MKKHTPVDGQEKSWQPFLRLSKYTTDDFVEKAVHLLRLVSEYGIRTVPLQGDDRSDRVKVQKFMITVHKGWKDAQEIISEMLLDRLLEVASAEVEINRAHRAKDKEAKKAARDRVYSVELEIKILRRILDVIIWTIFKGEHSTLRRLFVKGGQNNLSAENIRTAMEAARTINKHPEKFAISTDMLSLIHLGDLLIVDMPNKKRYFAELKSGTKNIALSKAAGFAVESGCDYFEATVRASLNKTDMDHFDRAKRQAARAKIITETIKNEGGIDHNTGGQVKISSMGDELPVYWSEIIVECHQKLITTDRKWAISETDKCLFVGVYSDVSMAYVGFNSWMKIIDCDDPIHNLMDSFLTPSSRPLGCANLPSELRESIFRGDVLVMISLDIRKLIDVVNKLQPGSIKLISQHEVGGGQFRKQYDLMKCGDKYIQVRGKNGTALLGSGFQERVIFDQHSPLQLLDFQLKELNGDAI